MYLLIRNNPKKMFLKRIFFHDSFNTVCWDQLSSFIYVPEFNLIFLKKTRNFKKLGSFCTFQIIVPSYLWMLLEGFPIDHCRHFTIKHTCFLFLFFYYKNYFTMKFCWFCQPSIGLIFLTLLLKFHENYWNGKILNIQNRRFKMYWFCVLIAINN